MYTLEHHRDLAYRAHSNTSFSPEKRAEGVIKEHSEQLDADLLKLKESGLEANKIDSYKKMYETHFTAWLGAKSNCISSMITGPAKFPTQRAEKANVREHNRYVDFQKYRELVFTGIDRRNKKMAIVAAGGELEIAKKKLEDLNAFHDSMKRVNKAHISYLKNPNSVTEMALSEVELKKVINYVPAYSWEQHPYPKYMLTNNLAKIKATEARVKELESKEEKKSEVVAEIPIDNGYIVLNYDSDRIRIYNNERPSADIIASYKKNGLKWSGFNKCWQRKITLNAISSMNKLFNIELNQK